MKKRVLITGANGFVGKNLIARLLYLDEFEFLTYSRESSIESLKELVEKSDVIVHLAGCNRSQVQEDFKIINLDLTETLCGILEYLRRPVHLIFSSTSQVENDTIYGRTKLEAEKAIERIANPMIQRTVLRLPNIFGKWSRPNYNSVVATFCHNISRNLEITINPSKQKIDFCYIDDIVELLLAHIKEHGAGLKVIPVAGKYKLSVSELYELIKLIHESRYNFTIQDFDNSLISALTATYNHYLPSRSRNVPVDLKTDQRGWLFEFIKNKNTGQIFISTTKPGFFRGNHFHHTKIEKFCVIKGSAEVKMRDIFGEDIVTYQVSDRNIEIIDIPTGYTHNIINTGDTDLITIFWASEVFSKERPDTYFQEV